MAVYLGSTPIDISETPYADADRATLAMHIISRYGQIEGAHHKAWVIDTVAKILLGTPLAFTLAKWDNGEEELRVQVGQSSTEYEQWFLEMLGGMDEDGEYEYDYDAGIPP